MSLTEHDKARAHLSWLELFERVGLPSTDYQGPVED